MSEFRRAYDLLRGYVNREADRIRGIDLHKAWEELQEGLAAPTSASDPPLESVTETARVDELSDEQREQAARQILGVDESAGFEEIRRAFEKLNRRSQPANFPEGSAEAENARAIHLRVNWAYRELTKGTSEMEKRFRSLEIE